MKEALKWVFKITLIVLAFYLVFKKVTLDEIRAAWAELHAIWLVPAFILYNISQFISTFRLLQLLHAVGVQIKYLTNLTLYYKAMFYGLFLPGGVSGDAYKVIYLQKKSESSYKTLITATLLDRVNGLTMLLSIAVLLLLQKIELFHDYIPLSSSWIFIILLTGWLLYIILHLRLFPVFNKVLLRISFLSLTIQLIQLLSFCCILYGFSIAPEQWLLYGILFYTGSVLAALPLSINGLGIREWVLVTGSTLLALDSAKAFSASLVFTMISAICALIGGIIKVRD
jgi:glycosyltransferase 2 family protein